MPVINTANDLKVGTQQVDAVYAGTTLVWQNSSWDPTNIPGLMAWIDASQDLGTFTEGQAITSYTEHSAAHRVFTYNGNTPHFRAVSVNGKPRLDFSGAGMVASNVNLGASGFTFVMFHQSSAVSSYQMMWTHNTAGDGYEMRYEGNSFRTQIVIRYSAYGIVYSSGITESANVDYVHMLRSSSAGSEIRVDNVVGGTGSGPPTFNVPAALRIGFREDGYHFIGLIAEALVYAGKISDADRDLLVAYLQTKWGP